MPLSKPPSRRRGFDASTASETAVDEAGNTFRTGSIDVNGTTYSWRVSAIALSEVYSISGLPESATYVGRAHDRVKPSTTRPAKTPDASASPAFCVLSCEDNLHCTILLVPPCR